MIAASVLVLVVPIGALLAGFIMEYLGRLNTIKIATVPCLLGWFLVAAGSNFTTVLCGRLLTGVAAGSNTRLYTYLLKDYLTLRRLMSYIYIYIYIYIYMEHPFFVFLDHT